MNYIAEFVERNVDKPFVANLRRYMSLDINGKRKVISSFLTHLFIDCEQGFGNEDIQKEVAGILYEYVYFGIDGFFEWFEAAAQEEG